MEVVMNSPEKQLKYSIRKVSVGAASVVIGALYLLMGAGIAHAEGVDSDKGAERTASSVEPERSGTGEPENKTDLSHTDAAANTYSAPVTENPLVASGSAKPRLRRALADGETGDAPAGGTSNTPTGTSTGNNETLNSALTERKGSTVQQNQPGVNIPKGNEHGAHDPNAHISFVDPDHEATVEEMWKIIQNMSDDFQNNERSYLRNMDTLGDELRFDKNGNVTTDPSGVKLQPGEIREISSFGGWTAIMKKDGETGKFAIGMKNKEGYFTGWYTDKNGKSQEGGMLGSNALDQIYVHEQALDRRFKYMLMLAKGRTIANKDDIAQDGSPFNIKTANSDANKTALANLPVKEREDILQHAPNIEGFNGIEKTFKAFSTEYGSRLKIDFVTGYISDFEGSKGTYRIVVKAIKKDKSEETVYDHTINRIDGVVDNEERYSQGVDLSAVNSKIKEILRGEFSKKVDNLANEKYKKKYPGRRGRPDRAELEALKEEAKQELAKNGDTIVELPIDKDELQEGTKKRKNKFKEELKIEAGYTYVANSLNTILSKMNDEEVRRKSPIWKTAVETNSDGTNKSKDPDRVYKLLDFILPTAKKIIYHADTDQLELETDPAKVEKHRTELKGRLADKKAELETANEEKKIELKKEISALESAIGSTNAYTYTEARNGSKQAKILGSFMKATSKPDTSTLSDSEYEKYHTNVLAAGEKEGLGNFTGYFVEKNNVTRTDVLADDELSKKITAAIGGDQDKLGKGGYFSTGDIPLGKDVVSYKVQVFAENKKRVGVNNQSPRLQYNLPILADFSVIQDTVEPSKEVARRIITKLKEQGKITEDKEKKIKEKIDKSKKTSELKSAMSGNVKVRYVDKKTGNVITNIKNEKTFGEKDSENRYTAAKDVLINSEYNVTNRAYSTLSTTDDKYYRLVADNGGLATGSAATTGTIDTTDKVVTFVYEETGKPATPTTGKGVVHFKKQVSETVTEPLTGYGDITLEGNVGDTFSSTDVDTRITELKKAGYEIVEDTFTTGNKTIDSTTDEDGQDPSQVYNVVVREKVETVTTPPTPDTPVDPKVPDGPKWPETGLAKSDLEKEVTRTITYVKKETADGPEEPSGKEPVTQPAHFKRSATYNLVTKVVTPGDWGSTDNTLTAVPTEKLEGYIADRASVEAVTVPDTSGNITEKVVYTKLGSWVPNLPKGVTPPEGTDMTPKPYPNHPTDPTKPGEPTDPNVPVIPYVPGYTPKIGETPLVPKVPTDPTQGYIPPKVPTTPGEDTPITYEADTQKAIVKYVVEGTTKVLHTEELTGGSETKINYTTANKLAELKVLGYELVTDGFTTETGRNFDKDKTIDQTFEVTVKPKVVDVPPFEPTNPKGDDNPKPEPGKPIDPENPNGPKWTKALIDKLETTKHVTRTITYVEDGTDKEVANKATDKVTFTRSLKVNVVTGDVVDPNVAWTSNDTTFDEVTSPVVKGYILKANQDAQNGLVSTDGTRVAASENLKATSENQNLKVVYTKLGSQVPKVPGVETPTPLPYPNNPTDPTKPGDPEYPQPGTPVEPNTPKPPVIPYVPGYTPKTPDGNPLVPVDPEHPENGYKVPPVPTEPGNDTPITYEKVPDKPKPEITGTKEVTRTIKYVDEKGNELAKPSTDKVTFTRNGSDWKAVGGDSTFDAVKSPVDKGYILKDSAQKVVEKETVKSDAKDETITVVYTKVGSYVPKVPEGVTPPSPTPYDNDPQDPSKVVTPNPEKPQDPNDPNSPKVPVIPYVPGYTPKIGETPLQPKVPNDPTQGYIPPVPTEPGKDTPIEYVKVPNTPSPEEPIKPTPESNHITIWVDENGKPLKPEKPGTHEPGNIPGYRFITTTTKDGVTIHKFEKITPVEPNNPVPQKPTTPIPTPQAPTIPTPESQIPTPNTPEANTPTSETSRREELPNTGTEANAGLASADIMILLAGLGLGFFKKKEEDDK